MIAIIPITSTATATQPTLKTQVLSVKTKAHPKTWWTSLSSTQVNTL